MGCNCSNCCCDCCKKPELKTKCEWISIVFLFLQLISITLSMILMYAVNKIYFDSDTSKSIAKELIDNLNTGYFKKFMFGKNNLYSSNFLSESNGIAMHFDKWPGTVEGCVKADNKSVYILKKESCDKGDLFLERITHIYIDKYADISFDIERSSKTYLELFNEGAILEPDYTKKKNEQCPEGKKNCGYIDTMKNILCLPKDEECPINYIRISSKGKPDAQNIKEISGKDRVLYYSNDPYPDSEEYPIIINEFKIADLEAICAIPNLYYSSIKFFELEALKKNYSRNCQLEDYSLKVIEDHKIRYTLIDEINNYDLYEENGIIQAIESSNLVNYGYDVTKYQKIKVGLYYRSHIGFNKACLEKRNTKLNLTKLIINYADSDKMKDWSSRIYFLWFTSISSLSDLVDISGNFIEYILKFILTIAPSFSLMIYSFYAREYDDSYEEPMKCSDEVTNANYNIMTKKIRESGNNIKWASYIFIKLVLVNIVSAVFNYFYYKKKKANNSPSV